MSTQMKIEETIPLIENKFLKPGFEYWFANHEHIRTPFPKEIVVQVKENTTMVFMEWVKGLKEAELNKMPDEEFAEMFETILFNEAIKLVDNEDQRLTISYPFMPRLGDVVKHKEHGNGKIIERKELITKENKKMMEITVSINETLEWKTQFELSA